MNVERFLIQVKQNLPEHEGVTTWVEDSALNVGYGKSESFEIRYPGGICYNAATEKTDEFYKLVEEADKAFKTVKEYIDLMDNAPELSARDFNMPYKLRYVLLSISLEVQLKEHLQTLKKQVLLRRKEDSETMAVVQAITMCLQTKNFYNL